MKDIVIRCPHKCHLKTVVKYVDGEKVERTAPPKILFIASPDAVGSFKVQCTGNPPREHGESRGWYEIELNGCGGFKVSPIPPQHFDLIRVPYVLESEG